MHVTRNKTVLAFAAGTAVGLLVGVGMLIGALASSGPGLSKSLISLPETALHAATTDSNENFAVATGPIDENAEGIFFLDSLTGDLQCSVINYRAAKFTSFFRTNVLKDLGIDGKKPKFLLVTGFVQFRTGGTIRPARCVAYVVDATTGRCAAYGVPWSNQNRPQNGELALLDVRDSRTALIRE